MSGPQLWILDEAAGWQPVTGISHTALHSSEDPPAPIVVALALLAPHLAHAPLYQQEQQ